MRLAGVIWLATVIVFAALPGVARAASCSEIAVGAVLSLTGQYSTEGVLTRDGYEFAVKRIRKAGGIKAGERCYNFRIVYRDDESSPERGVLVALRLIEEDRIPFMLAPNSAAVAEAVSDLANTAGVPIIAAQGMPRSAFSKERLNLFGLLTTEQNHLAAGLEFAVKKALEADRSKTAASLALITANEPYMQDLRAGVLAEAAQRRISVVVDAKLTDDLVTLLTILSKARRAGADVIMIAGGARVAARVARQLKDQPALTPIIAMTHCAAGKLQSRAGEAAGRILCAARASLVPPGETHVLRNRNEFDRAFKAHLKAYTKRTVPDAAAQAALAVYVLADALNRAGTRAPEQVRLALRATRLPTFFGRIAFSDTGSLRAAPMVWRQIQGGKYRVVAPPSVATHKFLSPRSGL